MISKFIEMLQYEFEKDSMRVGKLLSECEALSTASIEISENDSTLKQILRHAILYEEKDFQYRCVKSFILLILDQKRKDLYHPSWLQILSQITEDELLMLRNIGKNKYEFINTYDYTQEKGFFNYSHIRFDYPKDELKRPNLFDLYIHNLMNHLKLMSWPIYNQEPIVENGHQTGSMEYSKMVLTISGNQFLEAINFGNAD